jgi:hypothetical protein
LQIAKFCRCCAVAWAVGVPAGEWERDVKQGWGVIVYPSGNAYEGEWVADQKCGAGTMWGHTSGQVYRGMWERGVPNGLGEHVWEQDVTPGSSRGTCLMHNRWGRGAWGTLVANVWSDDVVAVSA